MLKYYIAMFLIMGGILFYIFLQDPCTEQFTADFSNKYPSYKVLDSRSEDGTPTSVQCRVLYQKPGSDKSYEEVWLYEKLGSEWQLSYVPEASEE